MKGFKMLNKVGIQGINMPELERNEYTVRGVLRNYWYKGNY